MLSTGKTMDWMAGQKCLELLRIISYVLSTGQEDSSRPQYPCTLAQDPWEVPGVMEHLTGIDDIHSVFS